LQIPHSRTIKERESYAPPRGHSSGTSCGTVWVMFGVDGVGHLRSPFQPYPPPHPRWRGARESLITAGRAARRVDREVAGNGSRTQVPVLSRLEHCSTAERPPTRTTTARQGDRRGHLAEDSFGGAVAAFSGAGGGGSRGHVPVCPPGHSRFTRTAGRPDRPVPSSSSGTGKRASAPLRGDDHASAAREGR
jgi:hypothetical protein